MLNGYRIIDADCHVWEPNSMWREYLEPEFRERAPRTAQKETKFGFKRSFLAIEDGSDAKRNLSDELSMQWAIAWERDYAPYAERGFDSTAQVMALDAMGVDSAYLYPSSGVFLMGHDGLEPRLGSALARAYNNWLKDFCAQDPKRLRGVGVISRHEPESMVAEAQRVARLGWKNVVMVPNPIKGRTLGDPVYEPFWTECEALGLGVGLHEVTHLFSPTAGSDRFTSRFGMHACSHPMEQMMALVALLEGGVFERHPKLQFAFLEAGCGWLPYWLTRLDGISDNLQWEVGENIRLKPSEYFRRQCFVSLEPSEMYVGALLDFIGEDNILFGSDYPHADHAPDILHELMGLEKVLPREKLQKILLDNPRRYYSITE